MSRGCGRSDCADSSNTPPKPYATVLPLLRAGDVVRFRSGSCPLTVSAVEDGKVTVVWFSGPDGDILTAATVPAACLNKEPLDG